MWATAARVGFVLVKNKKTRRLLIAAVIALFVLGVMLILTGASLIVSVVGMCQQQAQQISSPNAPSSEPSQEALSDIPDDFLTEYREQAGKYGIDWALLAAVGKQETNHGQDYSGCASSSAGARGPMQFIPSTWAAEGVDGNGDGTKDPCNMEDAIATGASYLANLGAANDPRGALCSYYGACADANANYAEEVMAQAEAYRGAAKKEGSGSGDSGGKDSSGEGSSGEGSSGEGSSGEGSSGGGSGSQPGSATGLIPPLITPAYAAGVSDTPQGWSLVEPDHTMTYYLETRFASYAEAAIKEWNALGGVQIEPAESAETANLVIRDVPDSQWQYGWAWGYTKTTNYGATKGEIVIKAETAATGSETNRKALMVHEIGHALGFTHKNSSESVMNQNLQTAVPTPMDVKIYKQTWGGEGSPVGADPAASYGQQQPSEECTGLGPLTSLARLVPGLG